MSRSTFSASGLDIGYNTTNMTYLYGLSDFFSVMFENPDKLNLILEAQSEGAAEVYSRFLQLASTISLEDIQNTSGQTLKLITIQNTDAVAGETNVYTISNEIVSSRYIANRPLLPTALLEDTVDYRIEQNIDGTQQIRFAKDIDTIGFSTRILTDGTTKQYALWFVDVELDEQWISIYYGNLIGLTAEASTEAFRNFVYGLYYIYINGPTLELIRKGLNLCLGVPLSRGTEVILDIRKYLETDQYIVITDQNQYVIPFGLDPIVAVGDTINVGDELAQWVEVKDYLNDGDWWINLRIPSNIIPSLPNGQPDRYATSGSHYDYLMRNYLKKHTFLVNVKVKDFKNNQIFVQLSDIISKAKPSYTQAIYIWTIPQLEETLDIQEDVFFQRRDQSRCDNLVWPIDKFFRGNADTSLKRGCTTFIRYNAPSFLNRLSGSDAYINGTPFPFQNGTAYGYVNSVKQYRDNTPTEKAWLRAINERGSENLTNTRNKIGFYRKVHTISDSGVSYAGVPVHVNNTHTVVPANMKILPLYITTQEDLKSKCDAIGVRTPDLIEWSFDIFNPFKDSESINSLPINEGLYSDSTSGLITNYSTLITRGTSVGYISNLISAQGFRTWAPSSVSDLTNKDYILGIRICDKIMGIYLVTANLTINCPSYFSVEECDQLTTSMNTRPARGLGPTSSGYYLTRGRGTLNYNNIRIAFNEGPLNDSQNLGEASVDTTYSDSENPSVLIDRTGTIKLNHKTELK